MKLKPAPDPSRNPKAFAFQSAGRARASLARSAEKEQRRLHGEWRFRGLSSMRVQGLGKGQNVAVHCRGGMAAGGGR